jgi:type 1 glutamine amidotransferase
LSLDPTSVGATGDYPLAWCTRYGEGRVFYTALGHFDSTWNDPRFQQHLRGGLEWAADKSSPVAVANPCA